MGPLICGHCSVVVRMKPLRPLDKRLRPFVSRHLPACSASLEEIPDEQHKEDECKGNRDDVDQGHCYASLEPVAVECRRGHGNHRGDY